MTPRQAAVEDVHARMAAALERRGLYEAAEYRPGRNFVRLGDVVRCQAPGGTFTGKVRRILARESDDTVVEVEVVGHAVGAPVRTVTPDCIVRKAQSRQS